MIDGQADSSAGLQVQLFEECWRDGQHDRATDFAQIGCMHAMPQKKLYSNIIYFGLVCKTMRDRIREASFKLVPVFEFC